MSSDLWQAKPYRKWLAACRSLFDTRSLADHDKRGRLTLLVRDLKLSILLTNNLEAIFGRGL